MPTSALRRWFDALSRPATSTYDRTVADCQRELADVDAALQQMVDETANYRPRGPMFEPRAPEPEIPDNARARELEVQRRVCEAEYLKQACGAVIDAA